ncbi:MAG TPA: RodZ domain-containing protein [Gammaproteobacteria bacterium]|nr:RodZ domain-containing protein [Gammaproteobacteria bacterium]
MAEAGVNPGAYLRAIREQRGLSLHQVAVELHVSDFILEALERGDYPVLGGAVFVRGHLRNYARALGIADAEVLSLYDQGQDKPTAPTLVTQHTGVGMSPRAREWTMRGATAGVVLVLLVLAISWWLRRPEEVAEPAAAVQVTGTPLPAPAAGTAATTVLLPGSPPAAPPAAAPHATPLAPMPVKAGAPAPHPARETHKAPVQSSIQAPTAVAAAARAPQQVSIGPGEGAGLTHAKFILSAASWVEVYDASGKRLYYDLAPAGDSLDLSGAGPLQVFLGNAPGVSIELNGAPFDVKAYSRADNTARFKLGAPGGAGD